MIEFHLGIIYNVIEWSVLLGCGLFSGIVAGVGIIGWARGWMA